MTEKIPSATEDLDAYIDSLPPLQALQYFIENAPTAILREASKTLSFLSRIKTQITPLNTYLEVYGAQLREELGDEAFDLAKQRIKELADKVEELRKDQAARDADRLDPALEQELIDELNILR